MESSKVEQDRKEKASVFVSELASIKQDDLESHSCATTIASSIEKSQPSPNSAPRIYQGQDRTGTSNFLSHSPHSTNLPLYHQNGNYN